MLGRAHFGEKGYPVREAKTGKEIAEDNIMQNFGVAKRLALEFATIFVAELQKEGKVGFSHFQKFFQKIELLDKDTVETLDEGLRKFFESDYFSAIHILTLQFEDFLRALLEDMGRETTMLVRKGLQEKTLGIILNELRADLGEDTYRNFDWVFVNDSGLAIRNKVAHGQFKKKHATPMLAIAVIQAWCILISRINISKKTEPDAIQGYKPAD